MTTVEALLGEVSPLLESRLALSSADQLFFGDSVLLTHHSNEGPTTSKGEHGDHKDKDHKKGRKGHGKGHREHHDSHHEHHGQHQDGLHAAIANVKETVKKALQGECAVPCGAEAFNKVMSEMEGIKKENAAIRAELADLRKMLASMGVGQTKDAPAQAPAAAPAAAPAGDDEFDLFGSSDEEVDEEKERIKQERLKAYAEKKAKKPAAVAKSSVILDIKPWDDETNMEEMESLVRQIQKEGLVWGGGKLIPLAYGIKKLQIICVIEDDKVSVDDLIDNITEDISDHVQSVDIHAFNKI